jgi:hypothetical protein
MICPVCHGTGVIAVRDRAGPVAKITRMIPCSCCIGGIASCCDGAVGGADETGNHPTPRPQEDEHG